MATYLDNNDVLKAENSLDITRFCTQTKEKSKSSEKRKLSDTSIDTHPKAKRKRKSLILPRMSDDEDDCVPPNPAEKLKKISNNSNDLSSDLIDIDSNVDDNLSDGGSMNDELPMNLDVTVFTDEKHFGILKLDTVEPFSHVEPMTPSRIRLSNGNLQLADRATDLSNFFPIFSPSQGLKALTFDAESNKAQLLYDSPPSIDKLNMVLDMLEREDGGVISPTDIMKTLKSVSSPKTNTSTLTEFESKPKLCEYYRNGVNHRGKL